MGEKCVFSEMSNVQKLQKLALTLVKEYMNIKACLTFSDGL